MISEPVKLVVFDLAGTVVDHGSVAPVVAIVEAFRGQGISISRAQARGPMGLHKRDHIRELLRLEDVAQQWAERHKRRWTEQDVQQLYECLVPRQTEVALRHADTLPGLLKCVDDLRARGAAVATTTGYPRAVAQPILQLLADRGLRPDATCCADEVPSGRPAPWMIFRNMESVGVYPAASVVKVGDTVPDIQAARNAGAWAVGVTETGSEFGLSREELDQLPATERDDWHQRAERKFLDAGAHAVIRSLRELCALLP